MKQFILFIALISSLSSIAQQLKYKDEDVDTIKIISNSSYFHFDSCGTTTGIYDEYIIVFDKIKNNYILNPYQRTEYKYTFNPDTSIVKQKQLKQGLSIDKILIGELLNELEISYIKPTFENIGISKKEFLKLTNKKHFLQVANWYKVDWQFEKNYSSKEENKKIFNACQNIDTFNLYLDNEFDTSDYIVITDVDAHFEIIISTNKTDYRFEGKYPNTYKQPWYLQTNDGDFKPILNFSINQAIQKIVPTNFSNFKSLKIEELTNAYIKWYLKRCDILF